ncbi:winged-helix domain-containing protein [Sporolactobacillus terrae]|uniref:DNA-binding response regulator n=1 Tax=Sporolactobacillus terrae TaxID=269673 RepID=A0A5K7WSE9_9BACL|nr:response regulator transcription factor [Sporolactobacillus terrae]BBN97601.1 DNA-binding response regulator [Sporolactobacillus terrae]
MTNILLVTPEPYQFQELIRLMESQFYHVSLLNKMIPIDELLKTNFDVMIFDELIDIDALLSRVSGIIYKPKICLIRDDNVEKRIAYFEKGCDICVPASSPSRLILAYIRSLISKCHELKAEEKKKKDQLLSMNKEKFEVTLCGEDVELTPIEFRLLGLLFQVQGEIQSRNYLTRKLYGVNSIDGKSFSFNTHISHLRKKLKCSSCSVNIENQVRVGYRLIVEKNDNLKNHG